QIATVGANVSTFQNTGLTASTAYTYRVRAVGSDGTHSAYTNEDTERTAGTGTGLTGRYYADSTFSRLKTTRTDATVSFDWGNGKPLNGMPSDNFTVRWVGQVQPTKTEGYTFYAKVDDNVRLWIDANRDNVFSSSELVLRRWGSANTTEYKTATPIQLEAGKSYNIQMDFREMSGGASAYLKWASPSVAKQVIPKGQLYTTFTGTVATDSGTTTIGIDNGNGSSTTLAEPSPAVAQTSRTGAFFSSQSIGTRWYSDADRGGGSSLDVLTDASSDELEAMFR
ncbi:MAG: PA14 domain-containing protein, partial [Planctomycetota bacterium]|nr:PA14 domain-containing protein [Planctomycetota bacterium]